MVGGPPSIREDPLSSEGALRVVEGPSVGQKILGQRALHRLTLESLPSVIGPSVGQRGPSVYQRGPSVGQRGPSVYQWGHLSVRLALRRSRNILLVRGALLRLTLEGPPSVTRPSAVRGALRLSGALCQSGGPSVYQRGPLSVRVALRRQKRFSWSEGPSVV